MFEALAARGRAIAERAKRRAIDRLAAMPLPSGIGVETNEAGIVLTGRALRRHVITDTRLREAFR